MNNLKKIISLSLLTLALGAQMLAIPMVMAQATPPTKGAAPAVSKTAPSAEKLQALNSAHDNIVKEEHIVGIFDMLPEIREQGGNCLNDKEKQDYIYTVLETPLAVSESIAQSKIVTENGHQVEQMDNGNGTLTRRCFRFTQILNLKVKGSDEEKVTDQYLIAGVLQPDETLGCPILPENRSYGETIGGNYYDCQEVTVLMSRLEQGGIGFLNTYISLIYKWAAGIIGIIAVLIMVISGLQIITAQGEPSAVEEAKKRIFQSIGGVLLLFFASALLYMINPTFFNPPTGGSTTTNSTPAP